MNWDDLRFFLAVHRAGTLAGAARELRVEHTTVSRRVAALEASMGARLFTRGPDGFALTTAGAGILPLAEQIEQAARAATMRASGEAESVEGVVRVAIFEGFTSFVARRIGELYERHPQLVVELLAGTRVLDLARGEADLAVRTARTPQPSLLTRRVGTAGWSVYASTAYLARRPRPASVEDLRGHEVVAFDESLASMPGARWLGADARGARVTLRGNGLSPVVQAAIAGMGLAVLPCMVAEAEAALVRVTEDVVAEVDLQLVAHPDLAGTARVRAVMDFVVDIAARDSAVLSGRRGSEP